jgi:hypothetical protein
MRFLIREQSFERLAAAGRLVYELEGQPTGLVEAWRVTDVADGYRFWRIDLDARKTPSGNSYLYHVVLNRSGQPVRIKFRAFGLQLAAQGDVIVDDTAVTVVRHVNGHSFEDVINRPPMVAPWFPAAGGLALLAAQAIDASEIGAVMVEPSAPANAERQVVEFVWWQEDQVPVSGSMIPARHCSIRWSGKQRDLWLDAYGWPVKMVRGDGVAALESTYIRHTP